jgi:hypothetical protein
MTAKRILTILAILFSLSFVTVDSAFAADAQPRSRVAASEQILISAEIAEEGACPFPYSDEMEMNALMTHQPATACTACADDVWGSYVRYCCRYTWWGTYCYQEGCERPGGDVLK